jgi:hypothetical protein
MIITLNEDGYIASFTPEQAPDMHVGFNKK